MIFSSGITNLGDFDDWINDMEEQMVDHGMQVMLKISIDLWRKIVLKTPVDTGRARASWNHSAGYPDGSVPDEGDHSEYKGNSVPSPDVSIPSSGKSIHISSNLNYITFLEEGSPGPGSDQAPQGMVQVSIQELVNAIG